MKATTMPLVPRYVRFSGLALALAVLLAAGCGQGNPVSTYPAGGRVSFTDGTPLDGGWVEFQLVGGPLISSKGEIQSDGTFELFTFAPGDGAPAGEHQALVSPHRLNEDRDPNPALPIDRRFTQFETSGLRFTVTNDGKNNRFRIQVERPTSNSSRAQ